MGHIVYTDSDNKTTIIIDSNNNKVEGKVISNLVTENFKLKYMSILDEYISEAQRQRKWFAVKYFSDAMEELETMPQKDWRCIIKYAEKMACVTFKEKKLLKLQGSRL